MIANDFIKLYDFIDSGAALSQEQWQEVWPQPGLFQFALEKSDNNREKLQAVLSLAVDNWTQALNVFQYAPLLIPNINPQLLNNEAFIIEVLKNNPDNITHLQTHLYSDDLALWFCWHYPQLQPLQYFPRMDNHHDLARYLIKHHPDNFKDLSDTLRNDLKIYVHTVIRNDLSYLFQYAGEDIRNDSLRAWQAVYSFPHLYRYVGETLKDDVIFFESVLKCHKDILQYAPEFIVQNKECVLKSLQVNGESLQWAHQNLRKDTDFAMKVSHTLDRQEFSHCFAWWDDTLFQNREFIISLSSCQWLTQYAEKIAPDLLDDNEFMKRAILHCPQWLEYCSERLKLDASFFISIYKTIETDSEHAVRFDKLSVATKLFSFLSTQSVNDLNFMTDFYEEFNMIFPTIVFPEIMNKSGELIQRMRKAHQNEHGLEHFMNRLRLHKQLLMEQEHQIEDGSNPVYDNHEQDNKNGVSGLHKI
jgi:hypothetical protein